MCTEETAQAKRAKVDVGSKTENTEPGVLEISEALAKFLGTTGREMTQPEASKRVWEYIKLNHLEVGDECIYPWLYLISYLYLLLSY